MYVGIKKISLWGGGTHSAEPALDVDFFFFLPAALSCSSVMASHMISALLLHKHKTVSILYIPVGNSEPLRCFVLWDGTYVALLWVTVHKSISHAVFDSSAVSEIPLHKQSLPSVKTAYQNS